MWSQPRNLCEWRDSHLGQLHAALCTLWWLRLCRYHLHGDRQGLVRPRDGLSGLLSVVGKPSSQSRKGVHKLGALCFFEPALV